MLKKTIISGAFGAAVLMTAVPVGITAVSSVAFVSEAQAFGLGSIKKAAKKTNRVVKRKAKKAKDIATCKTCPGGKWIDKQALVDAFSKKGKIGGKSKHDHRKPRPGGVAVTLNPWRFR